MGISAGTLRDMVRIFLIPSICLLLFAGVAFYARSGKDRQNEIVFANNAEIFKRDVTQMSWSQDINLARALYEGLVTYDPYTLEFRPGVAESWEHSADGQTWTFHLRKNAKWNNGDPVLAGDFIFSWKRALNRVEAAEYVGIFFNIKGAKAYYDAQDAKANLPPLSWDTVGLKALDDYTLQVQLGGACSYILELMAFPTFFPEHEPSMRPFKTSTGNYSADFTSAPIPGKYGGLVSNGSFMLKESVPHDYDLLVKNPFYWDRDNVKNPALRVVTRTDPAAALVDLQNGSIDILAFVPPEFAPELMAERDRGDRTNLHMSPTFATYYYLFNCQRPPLNDARVRMALCLVVDKNVIVNDVTGMHQRPINSITPPESMPGYNTPHGLDHDPERARKLLAEAGFPGGKGLRPIEILYNTEATHGQIAQAVGQMWQQELNIQVIYKGVDGKTMSSLRESHDFDVSRAGWTGDYGDPVTWLDLFRKDDGNNDGQYSNPEYEKILDQARQELDIPKRFALLEKAETMLNDHELPFLPLYQYIDGYMFDPKKITGLESNVRQTIESKYIRRVEVK